LINEARNPSIADSISTIVVRFNAKLNVARIRREMLSAATAAVHQIAAGE
jgi:hypothetical protein